MFVRLTNALTGRPLLINPLVIGDVSERVDAKYPKTKTALIKTDGSFVPIAESIEVVIDQMERALAAMPQQPTRTTRQSVSRPEDPSDPGPAER